MKDKDNKLLIMKLKKRKEVENEMKFSPLIGLLAIPMHERWTKGRAASSNPSNPSNL